VSAAGPSRGGDRVAGEAFASRSTVWGAHGAAATAHPLATLIAIDRDVFRDLIAQSLGMTANFDQVLRARLRSLDEDS